MTGTQPDRTCGVPERILGAVGLAVKARACVVGTTLSVEKMRADKGELLIVADDISENARKRLVGTAEFHHIPYVLGSFSKALLAHAAGKKSDTAAVLFIDQSFVKIIEKTGVKIHTTNTEVPDGYGSSTEV